MNFTLLTDSYKPTHHVQYPPGTARIYSYLESRGGRFSEVVFFGLQGILKKYFVGKDSINGGALVNASDVENARRLLAIHYGNDKLFNVDGWKHIVSDHGGRLPLSIKALPEGSVVPVHNALLTVENTCNQCYWLTNYVESLLMHVWYPITVATQSREIKKVILGYLKKNGTPESIDFRLHDFGFRGAAGVEAAAVGGSAHLVNFKGTDTLVALLQIAEMYGEECAGFSVPASEHSTITSWGRHNEVEAYRNMLQKYPMGIMACVIDSYDPFNAAQNIFGGLLKDEVLSRDGVLVIRPDSGNPTEVILKLLKICWAQFGGTYKGGYKVLNPKVRLIQGDGVNYDSIADILRTMNQYDWSADNITFGMGGALLQKVDRDTQKMAIKCSYAEGFREGPGMATSNITQWPWQREVYKEPITDPGKDSKRGRLSVVNDRGVLRTQSESLTPAGDNQLVEVYRNGQMLVEHNLADIRQRAAVK
jgi:nicotinamide phosphoribosyltransferase